MPTTVLDAENKEKRNRVTVKFTCEFFETFLPRIEKSIVDVGLKANGNFLFGDKITLADLYCLQLKILFSDELYNKDSYQLIRSTYI